MKAREAMVAPVVTVPLGTTLDEVARLMVEKRIGSVLVVNGEGRLVGIVTESDFLKEKGIPFSIYRAPMLLGRFLASWYTPLALLLYLLATRLTFLYERRRPVAEVERLERLYGHLAEDHVVRGYLLWGGMVVLAASLLPTLAERLAEETGLGASFVGTALVGATTSLPEVVVSLAAARLGAFDLAVGNVLGSNLFNALILAWDDLLYPGSFFAAAHESHLAAVLVAFAMYGVVLLGMSYQALRKLAVLSWDTLALLGLYLVGLFWLYALR